MKKIDDRQWVVIISLSSCDKKFHSSYGREIGSRKNAIEAANLYGKEWGAKACLMSQKDIDELR